MHLGRVAGDTRCFRDCPDRPEMVVVPGGSFPHSGDLAREGFQ